MPVAGHQLDTRGATPSSHHPDARAGASGYCGSICVKSSSECSALRCDCCSTSEGCEVAPDRICVGVSPESVFPCSALSWRGDAAHDPPLQVFTPKKGNTHLTSTNQNPTKPTSKINGRMASVMIAAPVIRVGRRLFSVCRKTCRTQYQRVYRRGGSVRF